MSFEREISAHELVLRGRRIHFIGIGGVSMSSIAIMAKDAGAIVSGCDICENEGTRACRDEGIDVSIGHSPRHIDNCDLVVFSSAIPLNSTELVYARNNNVTIVPRAVMLARLLRDRTSIGVAGSHGKTTTTYIVSQIFRDQGLDPAVMLGGRVTEWHSNFHMGKGSHFISEVDESDGSLLYLDLDHTIITNLDLDHTDFYDDMAHLVNVFRQYAMNAVKENIVAFGDDENLRMALSELDGRVTWYGLSQHNDYRATHVKPLGLGRSFDLEGPDGKVGQFRCPMLGEYNLHNCVGALALGHKLGLDVESMADSTAGLHGVVRRQDLLGERNGVKVLDDYAHHPTEIEATIRAVAELSPKRLVVVFQPHRYSRTAALHKELARSLTAADYVILSEIYPANEDPIAGVTSNLIAMELDSLGFTSYQHIKRDELILKHLQSTCRQGDLVMTMGAGDIRKLGEKYVS